MLFNGPTRIFCILIELWQNSTNTLFVYACNAEYFTILYFSEVPRWFGFKLQNGLEKPDSKHII